MNDVLQQWVEKAEEDRGIATDLTAARFPGGICFHVQQCVEKLMKGVLIACGIDPPKVHDLRTLDRLLRPVEPRWQTDL